jgi:hypothetical protein
MEKSIKILIRSYLEQSQPMDEGDKHREKEKEMDEGA